MQRNSAFYFSASFIIVSVTLFINNPDSLRHWTILMITYVSLFEIIKIVIPFRNISFKFLCLLLLLLVLTLSAPRGGGDNVPPPPCRFFYRCILSGSALKLILYDFSSNFILNMWSVKFFLISRIICQRVYRWPSVTAAYYGIVDSLLHRLSLVI